MGKILTKEAEEAREADNAILKKICLRETGPICYSTRKESGNRFNCGLVKECGRKMKREKEKQVNGEK